MNGSYSKVFIIRVAKMCHQFNKKLCEMIGDFSQVDWEDAAEWQRESAMAGVDFRTRTPDATPALQHEEWSKGKIADGWVYGPVKDAEKKTHPCLVPYDQLPVEQRFKDLLFQAVVDSSVQSYIERNIKRPKKSTLNSR